VPAEVVPLDAHEVGGRRLAWYRFQRTRRSGGGVRGHDRGFGFEIRFAEPVRGPILLGYGRFFGLGQFASCREDDPA
jgi:CRISPR-associated protein Csb2